MATKTFKFLYSFNKKIMIILWFKYISWDPQHVL